MLEITEISGSFYYQFGNQTGLLILLAATLAALTTNDDDPPSGLAIAPALRRLMRLTLFSV